VPAAVAWAARMQARAASAADWAGTRPRGAAMAIASAAWRSAAFRFPAPRAALVALAAALDPRDFATSLTVTPGRPLRLSVTSRHAAIGDDITADHRAYYYSWGEWIAPASDPATTARMITSVLRTTPQPTHG
jgi:hypothetical protein